VHVGRHPHHVLDVVLLDEAQQLGHLQLTPRWLAVLGIGPGLEGAGWHIRVQVGHHDGQRHVAGDQLPGRARAQERLLDPAHLLRPEEVGIVPARWRLGELAPR
jgi:hypothetical protein